MMPSGWGPCNSATTSSAAVMRAADHGAWLGTTVFDGARFFDGLTPDLDAHCARINRSAEAITGPPRLPIHPVGIAACPETRPRSHRVDP